jgi:hypothetical protein
MVPACSFMVMGWWKAILVGRSNSVPDRYGRVDCRARGRLRDFVIPSSR